MVLQVCILPSNSKITIAIISTPTSIMNAADKIIMNKIINTENNAVVRKDLYKKKLIIKSHSF